MAVQYAVGSFTVTTTDTVSKVVTGVGFQPQVYVLTAVRGAVGAGAAVELSEGVTDGTRSYVQGMATSDGSVGSSAARRIVRNDAVLCLMDSGGTKQAEFAHSAFGADGFTLSTVTTPTATCTVFYEAYAGLDNVYLDVAQLPGATGSFSRTAAGFQADASRWWSGSLATLNTATTAIQNTRGWAVGSTQFALGFQGTHAAASNYSASIFATDRVLYCENSAGTVVGSEVQFTSHDATGFTANRISGTSTLYYAVLHMKGGAWATGTTTAAAATGNFNVTTTGCNPAGVQLMSSLPSTVSGTPQEGANISLGAGVSSSARWAVVQHSYNAEPLGTTDELKLSTAGKIWSHQDRTSANTLTTTGDIDLVSLGSELFTLNQTDGDPTAVVIGWLAVGAAVGAGDVYKPQRDRRRRNLVVIEDGN